MNSKKKIINSIKNNVLVNAKNAVPRYEEYENGASLVMSDEVKLNCMIEKKLTGKLAGLLDGARDAF